jgi:hypothetical protein
MRNAGFSLSLSEKVTKRGPLPAAARSPMSRKFSLPVRESIVMMRTSSPHRCTRRACDEPVTDLSKYYFALVENHTIKDKRNNTRRREHLTMLKLGPESCEDDFRMFLDHGVKYRFKVQFPRILVSCQTMIIQKVVILTHNL